MKHMITTGLAALVLMSAANGALADQPVPKYTPVQSNSNQFVPPTPKKGFRYPDCFCTDSTGKRIELGKMTCLKIGSQEVLARCAMSLNNPTWRRIQNGCPSV